MQLVGATGVPGVMVMVTLRNSCQDHERKAVMIPSGIVVTSTPCNVGTGDHAATGREFVRMLRATNLVVNIKLF